LFLSKTDSINDNLQQEPQKVVDSIAELIEKSKVENPFRTHIDFIGMADLIQKYNEHLEQIMTGVYANFCTQGLLSVKK